MALQDDPLGRLSSYDAGSVTRMLYDGDALISAYNTSGTLLDRYVHGAGAGDDPLIWYSGTSMADSNARYLHADRLGSVVAITTNTGALIGRNTYDEHGIPGGSNLGRFQYTGQVWLDGLGMYYYKARMYSPTIGRFMQTDPIGYADGMNLYAYVGNDPVNFVDPTGLEGIVVTGKRKSSCPTGWICGASSPLGGSLGGNMPYLPLHPHRVPGFGGGPGGRDTKVPDEPQNDDPCNSAPRVLDLSATAATIGIGVGGVAVNGTVTDVLTGRKWSFSTGLNKGGALGLNNISLKGTVAVTPEQLSKGFSLSFATLSPLGFDLIGSGYIQQLDWDTPWHGELDAGGSVPGTPFSSVAMDFRDVDLKQTSSGICPTGSGR